MYREFLKSRRNEKPGEKRYTLDSTGVEWETSPALVATMHEVCAQCKNRMQLVCAAHSCTDSGMPFMSFPAASFRWLWWWSLCRSPAHRLSPRISFVIANSLAASKANILIHLFTAHTGSVLVQMLFVCDGHMALLRDTREKYAFEKRMRKNEARPRDIGIRRREYSAQCTQHASFGPETGISFSFILSNRFT